MLTFKILRKKSQLIKYKLQFMKVVKMKNILMMKLMLGMMMMNKQLLKKTKNKKNIILLLKMRVKVRKAKNKISLILKTNLILTVTKNKIIRQKKMRLLKPQSLVAQNKLLRAGCSQKWIILIKFLKIRYLFRRLKEIIWFQVVNRKLA